MNLKRQPASKIYLVLKFCGAIFFIKSFKAQLFMAASNTAKKTADVPKLIKSQTRYLANAVKRERR